MVKTYLDDSDVIIKAYDKNESLRSEIYERVYEDFMYMRDEEIKYAEVDGLEVHDNYNSFYFVLADRDAFLESAIDNDYLVTGKNINLHKELKEKMNEYYSLEKEDPDLEEYLDNRAIELMNEWESILHEYEYINDDTVKSYIVENSSYFTELYGDYYVVDDDYSKVFEDIPSHTERKF